MSEREQVWRERIEWQPWSGLTVVGADGGRVLRSGGRFGRLILSMEETADGAARSSATTIDATHGSAGIRSKEASVSVCADCPAKFFDESPSSAEHRIRPWQQHAN